MVWKNLGTLYHYELKKLVRRKLLWIALVVCILANAVSLTAPLFGSYYVDGELIATHYQMFTVDRTNQEKLSGRSIDDDLLKEMVEAYRQIPSDAARYTLTDEYQTYARPYSDIYDIVHAWTGMNFSSIVNWDASEDSLYALRSIDLEKDWKELHLTETEKAFWADQERSVKRPVFYDYHEAYAAMIDSYLSVGVTMLLLIAVILSSVFSEEHTRRTDQLILSSTKGKNLAYWAKIFAGGTVSIAFAAMISLSVAVLSLIVYGTGGSHAAIQLVLHFYSEALTLGQAYLIMSVMLMITALFWGIFVMVLSELLRSNIAALAVSTGLIFLGMIVGSISDQYRIISQIWDSLPMIFLAPWNVFSVRPITLMGQCFTSWQTTPIIYVLCSFLIAILGKRVFGRYQVSGR